MSGFLYHIVYVSSTRALSLLASICMSNIHILGQSLTSILFLSKVWTKLIVILVEQIQPENSE